MSFIRRSEHEALGSDDHLWILTHLDEWIATYFIPLPEPLNLPNSAPLRSFARMNVDLMRILQKRAEWLLELAEFDPDASRHGQVKGGETYWANKVIMTSSLLFHNVGGDFLARTGLDAAIITSRSAVQPGVTPSDISAISTVGLTYAQPPSDDHLNSSDGVGRVTVVEAAVPLRIFGPLPTTVPVIPIADLTNRAPEHPRLWGVIEVLAHEECEAPGIAQRINDGLDAALNDLRSIERGYYLVAEQPIRLMTRELLPPQIPFAVRNHESFINRPARGDSVEIRSGMISAHLNMWSVLSTPDLTEDQTVALNQARTRAEGQAFSTCTDLHRQASVALLREGDARLAALLTGVAAETFLDDLLLHLHWESGMSPESAAAIWVAGLDTRVKTNFAPLIGGSWDYTGQGAIGNWASSIAELRHRVVHAAHTPTHAEAARSLDVYKELVSYMCDRLANHEILRKFPRTALVLAGGRGLERRNAYTKRIRNLEKSVDEPDWGETFTRWRAAHRRIRRASVVPRTPSLTDSTIVLVLHPGGSEVWCAWNCREEMAARLTFDPTAVEGEFAERLGILRKKVRDSPTSVEFDACAFPTVLTQGEWIEQYHLIPDAGVMVDRTDYD